MWKNISSMYCSQPFPDESVFNVFIWPCTNKCMIVHVNTFILKHKFAISGLQQHLSTIFDFHEWTEWVSISACYWERKRRREEHCKWGNIKGTDLKVIILLGEWHMITKLCITYSLFHCLFVLLGKIQPTHGPPTTNYMILRDEVR